MFKSKPGKGIVASLIDVGDRLRLVVNDIECVEQTHDMPKLPVAGILWKPMPSLKVSAAAWILSGAAHHSVLSCSLTAENMRDFARIMNIEFVHIGENCNIEEFENKLMMSDFMWRHGK